MTLPSTARGRRRLVSAAVAALSLAACTEAGNGSGNETAEPSPAPSPGADEPAWCDVLETLRLPEDAEEVAIGDAPVELRVSLQFLAEAAQDEGLTATVPVDVAQTQALVEAWGHEHCGTVHPFCGVFAVVERSFPSAAPMQRMQLLDVLDDDLIRYAPDDLVRYAKDYVVRLDTSLGRPAPSDYAQRDGEKATDVLRGWRSSNCPGATP